MILTKQVHQKNASFVIIGTFKDVGFKFEPYVRNKCHNVLITAYALKKQCNVKCERSLF